MAVGGIQIGERNLSTMNYEQWNQAIISYFFEECNPGEIVFLQTDDETLSEIAELSDFNIVNPADSLKQAVRHQFICDGNQVDLWNSVPKNFWRSPLNQEAPQVAFLALTVLAASRMNSTVSISHTNYYARLNELLFGTLIQKRPKGLEGPFFKAYWIEFQRWAKNRYDVHLYLTEGACNRRYVWYPISQCLISRQDQRNIYRFFQATNLKPGSHLAESQLFVQLRLWKSYRSLPTKIREPIEQRAPEIHLILRQIQSLLKSWDGEVPEKATHSGIRRRTIPVDVQLCFDLYGNVDQIRYWFRCRDANQILLEPNALHCERLKPLNQQWFEPLVLDDRRSFWNLRNNLELKSTNSNPLKFRLEASDIWIFRRDPDRDDDWLSQNNLLLHEEHLIVFRERLRREVQLFLNQVCEESRMPEKIRVTGNETGWQYVHAKPIVFQSPLMGYHVTTLDQIRFVGGLPVDRRSNSYLEACLPEIVVPNLVASNEDSFYINGKALPVPSNRKIGLSAGLTPDAYHLSYFDCRTTLRVVSPIRCTAHEKQTSAIKFDFTTKKIPVFEDCEIAEISSKPGVWLAGAKLFGKDVPETTWDDIQTEPQIQEEDTKPLAKPPAELISLVIKAAIEHRQNKASIPDWLAQAIKHLDQNVALRSLVERKLRHYHETALSYADLCKEVGR